MQEFVIVSAVLLASFGLFFQCAANLKTRRCTFLAFPIALFLLMPYPLWGLLGLFTQDWILLGTMLALGIPSVWLSGQYFAFEWRARSAGMATEDRASLWLLAAGLLLGVCLLIGGRTLVALGTTAAYFTGCLVVYSFVVKMWKVHRGEQTLDGIKWLTLFALALLYGVMFAYGQTRGIVPLKLSYGFAEVCVLSAIMYKRCLGAASRWMREPPPLSPQGGQTAGTSVRGDVRSRR
jgi:hypothetical protein